MSDLEELFAESEETDAILVVRGKKMHVNKALLSYHSDYFKTLFNSDFKEKSMEEIEIKDVHFCHFATLLSMLHQNPPEPDPYYAAAALDLADRFLLPHLKSLLELFLVTSKFGWFSKIQSGGKHQLNDLLDTGLQEMREENAYLIHDIRGSRTFSEWPASVQVKILTRYLELFYF
ncbi:unnamed protein product [Caenorhabditis brenneri]